MSVTYRLGQAPDGLRKSLQRGACQCDPSRLAGPSPPPCSEWPAASNFPCAAGGREGGCWLLAVAGREAGGHRAGACFCRDVQGSPAAGPLEPVPYNAWCEAHVVSTWGQRGRRQLKDALSFLSVCSVCGRMECVHVCTCVCGVYVWFMECVYVCMCMYVWSVVYGVCTCVHVRVCMCGALRRTGSPQRQRHACPPTPGQGTEVGCLWPYNGHT